MRNNESLIEEINETANDIRRYCDGASFYVDLKKLDTLQLSRILTRLKVVENIMLDAWDATE